MTQGSHSNAVKEYSVDNTAMGMWSQGIEQWVRQAERLTPLPDTERLLLLDQLLAQQSLDELLATFASQVARIVRIRSLRFEGNQTYNLLSGEGAPHHHSAEIRAQAMRLGMLHYGFEQPLGGNQLRLLQQYHHLLALPLRLMLRVEQLQQQVRLDYLTGLGNRAHFDESIGRAVEQNCREASGLVLVLLDLDHFKQINDTWGHPAGDMVLSRFAHLLRDVIRTSDQAFRLGGDEFALILQPAESHAWQPVWRRLDEQLKLHRELSTFSVACSLGAASWKSGMNVHQLYELADADLYLHKQQRR